MKKYIFILLICIFTALPNLASNTLQSNDILQMETVTEKNIHFLFDAKYLLKEDYNYYLAGGKTVYGILLAVLDKTNTTNYKYKDVNIKYLEIMQSKIENVAINQIESEPLYIEDKDYIHLTNDVKKIINSFNLLLEDKNQYLNDVISNFNSKITYWNNEYNENKTNMAKIKKIQEDVYDEYNSNKNYINNYKPSKTSQEIYDKIVEMNTSLLDLSNKLNGAGYNYEKQKYLNWAKRNNKKIVCGTLSEFVYSPYATPKISCIYTHVPSVDFPLKIEQALKGGVLVTGDYTLGYISTMKNIFIQTSKQFVSNQWLKEPLVVEYTGNFDYITVLGAPQSVWKFYRYGENEIKNNFDIPGEKLYFYHPY